MSGSNADQTVKKSPYFKEVSVSKIVQEIEAGRYKSIKKFVGDHDKECITCKKKEGLLLHCTYCEKSEHLECFQRHVGDTDIGPRCEFVCHTTVQYVVTRINRANKRYDGRVAKFQKVEEPVVKEHVEEDELKHCPHSVDSMCQRCKQAYTMLEAFRKSIATRMP